MLATLSKNKGKRQVGLKTFHSTTFHLLKNNLKILNYNFFGVGFVLYCIFFMIYFWQTGEDIEPLVFNFSICSHSINVDMKEKEKKQRGECQHHGQLHPAAPGVYGFFCFVWCNQSLVVVNKRRGFSDLIQYYWCGLSIYGISFLASFKWWHTLLPPTGSVYRWSTTNRKVKTSWINVIINIIKMILKITWKHNINKYCCVKPTFQH